MPWKIYQVFPVREALITLDVSVDPPYEQIRSQVTNSPYTFKRNNIHLQVRKFFLYQVGGRRSMNLNLLLTVTIHLILTDHKLEAK